MENFKHEYSSITFTSAYNVKKLIDNNECKFCDVHRNSFESKWMNDIYHLFERKDEKIGLPLYLLYDISPSKIESFQRLVSNKLNTLGFFFFFLSGEDFPFTLHEISAEEIEKKYGSNKDNNDVQVKNLIIINDQFQLMRDRRKKLKKLI